MRSFVEAWEGDIDLQAAVASGKITTHGVRTLERSMPDWLGLCAYKDIRPVVSDTH